MQQLNLPAGHVRVESRTETPSKSAEKSPFSTFAAALGSEESTWSDRGLETLELKTTCEVKAKQRVLLDIKPRENTTQKAG